MWVLWLERNGKFYCHLFWGYFMEARSHGHRASPNIRLSDVMIHLRDQSLFSFVAFALISGGLLVPWYYTSVFSCLDGANIESIGLVC